MNLITASSMKDPKFIPPTREELDGIEPGSFVRVSRGYERFWVEVTETHGDKISGIVDSEDVSGFKYGAGIKLRKDNVLIVFY